MNRSLSGKISALCVLFLLCGLLMASMLRAQCKPGDILLDEDDERYYCATRITSSAIAEIVSDLYNYLVNPPPEELLGQQWRYRKEVVETLGWLARKRGEPGMTYGFGGKLIIQSGGRVTYMCVSKKKGQAHQCDDNRITIDCSGAVGFADRFPACFVAGFYEASCGKLGILDTSARLQYAEFRRHGAATPANGKPQPGDSVFFKRTVSGSDTDISHVGLYLGKGRDNVIRIIHASWNDGEVEFTRLPPNDPLTKRIVGYGNISKLYNQTGAPR